MVSSEAASAPPCRAATYAWQHGSRCTGMCPVAEQAPATSAGGKMEHSAGHFRYNCLSLRPMLFQGQARADLTSKRTSMRGGK